jgi:hypothetical protein
VKCSVFHDIDFAAKGFFQVGDEAAGEERLVFGRASIRRSRSLS